MTEKVLAVHTVTGIISEVWPHEIETIPALVLATQNQILAAKANAIAELFGEPAPTEVVVGGGWPIVPEDEEVTTKDGADNG